MTTKKEEEDINVLVFLPGSRWCCPPVVNDWKQGEQGQSERGEGKERQKRMNESDGEERVSALRALG